MEERYRVIMVIYDDYGYGYDTSKVIADWLDLAQAKSIFRHFGKKYWYDENISIRVEEYIEDPDFWGCISHEWAYREQWEEEEWFKRKGYDYMWWLQFGEIRKVG